MPDVLVQLITGFETFLKKQKAESDLISKYSDTSMKKVLQDTTTQSQVQLSQHFFASVQKFFYSLSGYLSVMQVLAVVSSQVQKDAQTVSFLAQETAEVCLSITRLRCVPSFI